MDRFAQKNTIKFWYVCALFVLIVLVLIGCQKSNDNPMTPVVTSPSENRMQVLDACETKFRELDGITTLQARQQLVVWLKSRPEFEAAGIATGENNVWARFTDGRFLMFINNRETVSPDERGGRVGYFLSPANPAGSNLVRELPTPLKVTLLNGMGTHYIDETGAVANIIGAAKTAYQVTKDKASVDNLKNIKDDAIFYLSTHGGGALLSRAPGDTVVSLGFWTTDSVTAANEARFADDLKNDRLGYVIAYNNDKVPRSAGVTEETHYAFTSRFVDQYMSFGENALICFSACSSFRESTGGETFRNSILKKPGVYVGWTQPVKSQNAYVAFQFLFDRLLGANGGSSTNFPIPKEDPPQRSFDIEAVYQDLLAKGLGSSVTVDEKGVITSSRLKIDNRTSADKKLILTPSIAYMDINETNSELSLYGIFGSDPLLNGGVTVNGTAATNIRWTPDKITCTIPYEGAGSAGDVVVKSRGHSSNPVPLTEWQIEMNVTEGTNLTVKADITLHLRADVHRSRKKPGEKDPTSPGQNDMEIYPLLRRPFANDSKATVTAAGSCTYACGCETNKFSRSGTKEYKILNVSSGEGLSAQFGWEKRDKLNLMISFTDQKAYTETTTTSGCSLPSTTNTNVLPYAFTAIEPSGSTISTPSFVFSNPSQFDFTIRAGSFPLIGTTSLNNCTCNATLALGKITWKASVPRFAPTDKTAARIAGE